MLRMNYADEIRKGAETAFINSSFNSNLAFRPEVISNDPSHGKKVLSSLLKELSSCDEFFISVAFITEGGIQPLLGTLKELEKKNIPGKILTTDYQFFTEPKALSRLAALNNIELKMYSASAEGRGFHTKGYIFRQEEIYKIIIGSSNMTQAAITVNAEWNTKFVSEKDGAAAQEILNEFYELWSDPASKGFAEFYEKYLEEFTRRKLIRRQQEQALKEAIPDFGIYTLEPNRMQAAFTQNLKALMNDGQQKALLLSATGTGKTYASAFGAREANPARLLFVVHREQIAKQAKESYRRVFGNSKTYGLISGNSHEFDKDLIFSTMQMMSKKEIYTKFDPEDFDLIILDEAHHSGSESYRRIMNYFRPRFWLGMTASPDTNNYDIYSIFDHNIAYEIRLQQALEEDLLCPFHYYGITDLEINGETFNDQSGVSNFAKLTSDARVEYIIEKALYYGYSGERVKGLIFCSRKEEAKELSEKFNEHGLRTKALVGDNTQLQREETIARLAADEGDDLLDYIFTVDIFNEGVDIPEINQVIMLRPTQSPVVFVQQLGRGLRKFKDKEYVVIIDFIGNYMNNYMIPIALSGDKSYNKDAMRHYVKEGSRIIPGSSTIYFDEISRRRIYDSIDRARTNDIQLITDAYRSLKYKLGRIPKIREFKEFGSIDIKKIFNYKTSNKRKQFGSYHEFLKLYEDDYSVLLSDEQEEVIRFLSKKVTAYKRIHELALLKRLINHETITAAYEEYLGVEFQRSISAPEMDSVVRNLTNEFPLTAEKAKYPHCVLIKPDNDGGYILSESFRAMLKDDSFRQMVLELIDYGIDEYREKYSDTYKDTNFVLYQKYDYEDVCRLINMKKNMNPLNVGGYFYDKETKTLPVFINYRKEEGDIAYEDHFTSESSLIALSKNKRRPESSDADHIYKRTPADKDNRIYLFVRKNKKDEGASEFYFLGEIFAEGRPKPKPADAAGNDLFEITYRLDVPVRSDIYDYITSE